MLLIIHTLRVDRLVERRTAELQASIAERDALEKANQANAQMLAQMERAGIVAQLSSMVAHELRQPLMSIMNFVGGLSLYMRKTYPADPIVAQTADVIVEEAERASAIVDRVRGYDKTAHAQKIPIAAKDLIASAVRAFSHSALSSRRHRPHGLPYQCMRFGRSSRAHIGHSQFPQKRRGCHGGCLREGHSLVCPAIWRRHCF